MSTYIAFLRAINVANRYVKKEALRQPFVALGFENVQTYIQSGNVIFETAAPETAALEQQIEAKLAEALGFEVPTMVRTAAELQAIAASEPFPAASYGEKSVLYVTFLKAEPADEQWQTLRGRADEIDEYYLQERELFWLNHKHMGDSKMSNGKIEKLLKQAGTRRNISTVNIIVQLYLTTE
ncbi:MAG: DUF1697 domain-containing protein [Anaerolineales bacterium]|nr:DUF1697 domain-containing protein [Anaerolineales bacterium]